MTLEERINGFAAEYLSICKHYKIVLDGGCGCCSGGIYVFDTEKDRFVNMEFECDKLDIPGFTTREHLK